MQDFNIVKKTQISNSYRVSRIMADFDLKNEHCDEHFVGQFSPPAQWNIGLIVGASGTGKTTIAKELFADCYINGFFYDNNAIIDNMPQNCTVDDIEKMFYAVGFGSVPNWLKPYEVLSNGEKMRVNLARALLEKDKVCFDEFTSVVDRQVAQTACMAINKAVKNNHKQFIAVSCHYDIIEWLQPDWVFDTNKMQMVFMTARDIVSNSTSKNAGETNGKNLGSIII